MTRQFEQYSAYTPMPTTTTAGTMTDNRTTELLPCPFCGGEAEIHPSNDWDTKFTGSTYFAWCDKCETRGDYHNTEAEAIAAWNTRADYYGYEQAAIEAWESIKAWNTRAELGSERIAELEAENERLRKAGYEIGYHDAMKAAKRGGTLTAEQVREAIRKYAEDDSCYIFEVYGEMCGPIADELNAELGSGTCENIAPDYLDFLCSKCGFVHYHSEENDTGDGNDWNYCPNCGKRVSA